MKMYFPVSRRSTGNATRKYGRNSLKLLKDEGICNYSIFLDEETNTLFAYQEQAGSSSSQDLGQTEIVKKWWKYMADIMETNPDNSPITIPLEQVFYME